MLICGAWVKKGIAKEQPDKVSLEEEDLKKLVEETKNKIENIEGSDITLNDDDNDNDDDSPETKDDVAGQKNKEINDDLDDDAIRAEYGLDNYDEEAGSLMTGAGMAGLMFFDSNTDDPYINVKDLEEEERADSIIKKNDSLFVLGKMEEEYSSLDIYVYNEHENSLFVHHDILIDSFPLCLEWLSFDPCAEEKSGNFIAVGTMEPEIQIWDLDVIDTIEPVLMLGQKKKKKKKKKKTVTQDAGRLTGHTDSVLTLAWNKNVKKILASGSADSTVLLWDLSQGTAVHSLKQHTDKVQSISWHPVEAQSLLTASFDKTAVVVDCRNPQVFKSWSLSGECEQVLWDHFSPYNFFVSSDDGVVAYFDVRTDTPVFNVHAHEQEVTGISLSNEVPGCLVTVSADEYLKVWSYRDNNPVCVLSRDMKMGGLHFAKACPDIGLTFALGGQKDGLRVLDLLQTTQGKEHFQSVASAFGVNKNQVDTDGTEQSATRDTEMDAVHATEALSTLSLKKSNETENVIIKRKKKKKK